MNNKTDWTNVNKSEATTDTTPNALDVAANLRKQTQNPNAVASAHEIHGEISGGIPN